MSSRKKPLITFIVLAAFCGLLVSMSNLLSRDRILENQIRFAQKQLMEIANDPKTELLEIETDVYQLRSGGEITGVVFRQSTSKGYNGNISFWLGVNTAGEILGVRVISHKETPGLGDKIETGVSDWIHTFAGKSLANLQETDWAVKKNGGIFDQFSGATITPAAVIEGVETGLVHFESRSSIWAGSTGQLIDPTTETLNTGENNEY